MLKKIGKNNYKVNQLIFRLGVLAIILLFIAVLLTASRNNYFYAKCNDQKGCTNPFYIDTTNNSIFQTSSFNEKQLSLIEKDCSLYSCDVEFLNYGVEVGEQPPLLFKMFIPATLLIIFLCFLINHLLYNKKSKIDWSFLSEK